jgi:hypothetical protein
MTRITIGVRAGAREVIGATSNTRHGRINQFSSDLLAPIRCKINEINKTPPIPIMSEKLKKKVPSPSPMSGTSISV